MYEGIKTKTDGKCEDLTFFRWHGTMVGVLEALLYTSAILLHKEGFIAVWLALKVAGQWGRWSKDIECEVKTPEGTVRRIVPGRTIYNIFIIGTGLMIAYGVAGGKIIEWAKCDSEVPEWQILIAMIALIAGTLGFFVWECLEQRADKKKSMKEHGRMQEYR